MAITKVDELVTVFSAQDKLSPVAKSMATNLGGLEAALAPLVGGALLSFTAGVTAAVGALGLLGGASIRAAVDMDTLERSLGSVTGGGRALEDQMKRLERIAELPGLKLNDAVQSFVDLVSGGLDPRLAERSLAAFGNALASVGRGAADLGGALYGLRQLATSDILKAEDLNIIVERVPQASKILRDFYGTARGEELTKQGVTPGEAIETLLAGLEKLPSVAGGAQNALDNLDDKWTQTLAALGKPAKEGLIPILEHVTKYLSFLKSSGIAGMIGKEWASLFGGKDARDGITKFLVFVTKVLLGLPKTLKLIASAFSAIINFWVGKVDAVLGGIEKLSFGTLKMPRLGDLFGGSDVLETMFGGFSPESGIEDAIGKALDTLSGNDKSNSTLAKIERNTRPLLDFQQFVLGGGNLANMGVTPAEIKSMKGSRSRSGDKVEAAVRTLVDEIYEVAKHASHRGQADQRRMGFA